MSENRVYAIFWCCIAAVIISITVAITGYNMNKNALLESALKTSTNHMATACALEVPSLEVCQVVVAKQP
jgi:hypothetical protein